jgi:hypothetical protein
MKIWNSFGSEHSANLVIIGKFKDVAAATRAEATLNGVARIAGTNKPPADLAMEAYKAFEVADFSAADVEGMNLCHNWKRDGDHIVVNTDDTDIQGILKIMLRDNAKIEVYSAHSYPG